MHAQQVYSSYFLYVLFGGDLGVVHGDYEPKPALVGAGGGAQG